MGSKGLWFNRSKIKSSYGKDVRSGMVIRVTYDSDAGTLSFGLHNNTSTATTASGSGSNNITSWGVAFKDLKSVGTLYPAVCLYNRHDEFTIKRVPAAQVIVVS